MMVNACLLVIAVLLIQHPAASHGRQRAPNAHQRATAGRSLFGQQKPADNYIPTLTAAVYDKYDQYVTPWHDLGVTHYMDVGSWGGLTYQIHIWLRFPCSADSSTRPARLVVALNQAPARKYFMDWTEVIPKQLLVDGKLPAISFRNMADPQSEPINATISIWGDLVKSEKSSGVLVGHATLNPDVFYIMGVEGSERVFQIPPKPCSTAATAVFGGNSAWIGIGGRATKTNPPATYAFLVMEHVRHHMKLGFAGLAIVVQPHVAVGLLATADFARMVEQRHILLLTWVSALLGGPSHSCARAACTLPDRACHSCLCHAVFSWDVMTLQASACCLRAHHRASRLPRSACWVYLYWWCLLGVLVLVVPAGCTCTGGACWVYLYWWCLQSRLRSVHIPVAATWAQHVGLPAQQHFTVRAHRIVLRRVLQC
jgi:hypothetical protein